MQSGVQQVTMLVLQLLALHLHGVMDAFTAQAFIQRWAGWFFFVLACLLHSL